MEKRIKLAQELPPQLLHLFKRFPPQQLVPLAPPSPAPKILTSRAEAVAEAVAGAESISSEGNKTVTPPSPKHKKSNPFLPWKNPETGNWHGPHYSLRRQADLYRLAIKHDVLPLMPKSPKHPEIKEEKRLKQGIRVRGTGVGQKVKGHKWERMLPTKLEKRRQAMAKMPALIRRWKELGKGKSWKKYPR